MTLDQLKTFLSVARLGGVRRAAKQMNISQPAISARIAALETSLGTLLFERKSTGVLLNKQGVLLRNHAEQIALSLERIKAEVVPPEGLNSLLRLGVAETIAQSWLPDFLAALRRKYPNLNIEISVDISLNLRELLLDRALDLALLMGPVSEFSANNIDLPTFELSWFRPKNLGKPDLTATPIISFNRNSRPFRELRHELLERYGGTVQIFPTNSLSAGFEMVAAGIGVGVFPSILGQRLLEAKQIVKFNPGWHPKALRFTASYVDEPHDELAAQAAQIALRTAEKYAGDKPKFDTKKEN